MNNPDEPKNNNSKGVKRKRHANDSWKLGASSGKTGAIVVRPETQCKDPKEWFNAERSSRYATSHHVQRVQRELTDSAWQLLLLLLYYSTGHDRMPRLVLDCGSGSGLSAKRLVEVSKGGMAVVGFDISSSMVEQAVAQEIGETKQVVEMCVADMASMPFKSHAQQTRQTFGFEGAISISAVQWLFEWAEGDPFGKDSPFVKFLRDVHASLDSNGCAVFQFYPASSTQTVQVCDGAGLAGFDATVVMDFPHGDKSSKYFLCLSKKTTLPDLVRRKSSACVLSKSHQCPCALQLHRRKESTSRNVSSNQGSDQQYKKLQEEHFKLVHKLFRTDRRLRNGGTIAEELFQDTKHAMERVAKLFSNVEEVSLSKIREFGDLAIDTLHYNPNL